MSEGNWQSPLEGFRVVEIGTGIASGYAGKLFVDAGAEVIKVEPVGGDPLRWWSASGKEFAVAAPLFSHLAAGKTSIIGSATDANIEDLLCDADIVIESGEVNPATLRRRNPRLVVISLTPFGRTGPYADRAATEFIVQAECGSIAGRGVVETPPVQWGGRTSEWAAGVYGAAAGLAVAIGVRNGADGAELDVSWIESAQISSNLFSDPLFSFLKGVYGIDPPLPARSVETPSIYPTADGWIGFNTNGPQHAEAFLRLIERPELIDEGYVLASNRTANRLEFDDWVRAYTTKHTTAEILARAGELRCPTVRVNDGESILQDEQLVAREFFASSADGSFMAPRPHYLIDNERPPKPKAVPVLGSGTVTLRGGIDLPPVTKSMPLEGLKVFDVTCWWAGPSNTQLLAALGAEVIHVESVKHPDPMRYAAAVMFIDRDQWWEMSSFYVSINTNKLGITIDLNEPDGIALAERLVQWADIVVENYTPRVMPKFGLGPDRIRELNDTAVMVRQPAFGLTGPWLDRVGFAQNMEQMSGLAYLTGYPDQEPLVPRGPGDPLGGAHGAFATLTGLVAAQQKAKGCLVEVALVESAINIAAEPIVEFTGTGVMMQRDGNRSAHCAPQGLYDSDEDEQWVAISIADNEQWNALCQVVNDDRLLQDKFATHAGRREHHDEIDVLLSAWTKSKSRDEAISVLTAAGVPAGKVQDPRLSHENEHLQGRKFFEESPNPVIGSLPVPMMPWRMNGIDKWMRRPAPLMGEHNQYVFSDMLGISGAELERLKSMQIIGDKPAT